MNGANTVPVLIVGGGPVGLALATDLGTREVPCLLVDARDGSINVPKMTQVTARTMEYCRHWGIAEAVEGASWPQDYPQDFVYLTTLTGYEMSRSVFPPYDTHPEHHVTPNGNIHCPQIFFDPLLKKKAESLETVTMRYHTRLESFADEGDRVRARVLDLETGRAKEIEAAYLVGCDGADSIVREGMGSRMLGEGRLSYSVSVYFRSAELGRIHDKGWARFYRFIDGTGHWGDLVGIDGKELWRLTLLGLDQPATVETTDVEAIMKRAVGRSFGYDVISVLPWERRDQVADRWGRGRVFIAGDAAQQLSPTGGLGMNTGVCSAADLGWKLAAVLAGWGGPGLLDSYDLERRPVARRAVDESTAYYRRTRIFPTDDKVSVESPEGAAVRARFAEDVRRLEEEGTLYVSEHVKLGYCYEDSPICIADGTTAPEPDGINYVPNARPGARAPHYWLSDGRSILDLFGDGFVLLRFGDRPPPADDLARAAAGRNVPLAIVDRPEPEGLALYERKLVLVRPDGHVAWRSDTPPADADALIDCVRGSAGQAKTSVRASESENMTNLHISVACGHYDRTEALRTGAIRMEGAELTYLPIQSPQDIFTRMVRNHAFDAAEMSMAYYVKRRAEGDFPFIAIPVFPSRLFRHGYIYVNIDAGIEKPQDLNGKRIGLWDYHHTAAVWIRGMLADEYGVDPETIRWFEGGVNAPRQADSVMHLRPGRKLSVEFIGAERYLDHMLVEGEIDAILGAVKAGSVDTNPKVRRLFPDFREVEKDYFRRTGIFPIMHTLVMREALHHEHPWMAENLFDAFDRAKAWSRDMTAFPGTLRYMLPWLHDDLAEVESTFGGDPWPYGLEANRVPLEAFLRYMVDQGFLDAPPAEEDLFVPITGRALG